MIRVTLTYVIDGEQIMYSADLSDAGIARVIQVMDDFADVDEEEGR